MYAVRCAVVPIVPGPTGSRVPVEAAQTRDRVELDDLDTGGPQRGDGPFERDDGLGPGGGPLVAAVPGDAQPS